jgi:hypothetical protein
VINTAAPLPQTPAVAQDEHGCLWAAVKVGDAGVWAVAQRHPGRAWQGWIELGRPIPGGILTASRVLGTTSDGRLELLATAQGYAAVWHCWQRHQGSWSPWKLLGTPAKHVITSAPVAAQNKDGRLEVFIIAGDQGVWHCQQRPEGGWSPLVPMDQAAGPTPQGLVEVAAGAHADLCGHVQLIARE